MDLQDLETDFGDLEDRIWILEDQDFRGFGEICGHFMILEDLVKSLKMGSCTLLSFIN